MHVSPHPHPELQLAAPAWAEDGRIVLGPAAFLLPPEERESLVRHETIHALQQRLAPSDDSPQARARAERLADRPSRELPPLDSLLAQAPRLLAAPVKGTPEKGFTRLFGGNDGIIGEVVESGVTVRAARSYGQLGISAPVDPKSKFGTSTMTDLQFMACSGKSFASLSGLPDRMRLVAKPFAATNRLLAKDSPFRVELVLIATEASRLHFVDGKSLVTMSQDDFDNAGPETAAHEASHALFDSHTNTDRKDPTALAPDTFSLRFADLFARLAATTAVPIPTEPFAKAKPPLAGAAASAVAPAGLVMVADVLWQKTSAAHLSADHPWDRPEELFASAHGAFVTDKKVLAKLIDYYAGADSSIKSLGKELLDLLAAVEDSKRLGALRPLGDPKKEAAATTSLRPPVSGPSTVKDRLGAILNPETLPPEAVLCPSP
jgi:hypothetical protein